MRKLLLLFVLLCIGTYLSAGTLTARYPMDSAVVTAAQQALHFADYIKGNVSSWNKKSGCDADSTPKASLIMSRASCDSATYYINGTVTNLVKNDVVMTKLFDYGDGTTGTAEGNHLYTAIGNYTVTFTAVTLLGNTYTTTRTVSIPGLPVSVSLSLHKGAQDTIFAKPDYRDTSFYTVQWWGANANQDFNNHGWYVIPTDAGGYDVYMIAKNGCGVSLDMEYTPSPKPPVDTARAVALLYVSPSCDSTTYTVSGGVDHLRTNETIVSKSFNFGDGTTATENGSHLYPSPGAYTLTFTALTSTGNSYTTSKSIYVSGLPVSVSLSLHKGAQDTIFAKPDYRDTSFYTVHWWGVNGNQDFNNHGWYIIPKDAGWYDVYITANNGCAVSLNMEYTPPPTTPVDTTQQVALLYASPSCDSATYTISGGVDHLLTNETIVSKSFDFGDGTTATENSSHLYTSPGVYTLAFTALTSAGNSYSTSKSIHVGGLPVSVSLSIHHGVQDTIFAKPDYRDTSFYTVQWWGVNGNQDFNNHGWYVIPKDAGWYDVYITAKNGCVISLNMEYTPPVAVLSISPYSCDSTEYAVSGSMEHLYKDDVVVSKSFDFGDGTTASADGKHIYTSRGRFTVTFTAVTSTGNAYTATQSVLVTGLPVSISLSLHRGVQDTIFAKPDYRDISDYTVDRWTENGVTIPGSNNWYFLPSVGGYYNLYTTAKNGCKDSSYIAYTPPAPPAPSEPVPAQIIPPAANASQLDLSADFGTTSFKDDNQFTIELTVKSVNGRKLAEDEVINLGTVKGTDPAHLSVAIPDSLNCASNYIVRVVSNSPADTTLWSSPFTITNQPAQPVITQVGDSLFTSSIYELQWYKDDVAINGATSKAIRARANGAYRVAALNGVACSSLSAARAVVITAISNVSLGANTVSVFPNPSEGPVNLKFGYPLSDKVFVKVYNLNGAVVYATTTLQQQSLLDLTALPRGFYTVEVRLKDSRKVLTIILQ
ncbi:PKD domain-containing protein [Chitinophaga sancti]|uniref:PKD domain-containing protein n=1 Tax=Chitinophaga sancti TaxID=1004 RepID=UPI003F78D0C6